MAAAAGKEATKHAAGLKVGGPAMKHPTFSWEANDKYSELKTFRLEVNNILTKCTSTPQAK